MPVEGPKAAVLAQVFGIAQDLINQFQAILAVGDLDAIGLKVVFDALQYAR
ncbi:hypothetical protein [Spirosoma endbachense]|uniref:Uncharacterized protein n=1 Tax=Spirosoma endbachense TaxID=2666025 RepID=A0A6P1VV30_9BACT|nr:hypothetical protein [Spirosoma endbachense]QHV97061.1 hypothetical protein GJR95_19520 [Spirosoma endbachense]